MAYRTAYLKAHYPVEFMAALLTYEMGDTDKVSEYMDECRRMGIEVQPPDINESESDFTVVGDKIRFGLAAVKGIGERAVEAIVAARQQDGPVPLHLPLLRDRGPAPGQPGGRREPR